MRLTDNLIKVAGSRWIQRSKFWHTSALKFTQKLFIKTLHYWKIVRNCISNSFERSNINNCPPSRFGNLYGQFGRGHLMADNNESDEYKIKNSSKNLILSYQLQKQCRFSYTSNNRSAPTSGNLPIDLCIPKQST